MLACYSLPTCSPRMHCLWTSTSVDWSARGNWFQFYSIVAWWGIVSSFSIYVYNLPTFHRIANNLALNFFDAVGQVVVIIGSSGRGFKHIYRRRLSFFSYFCKCFLCSLCMQCRCMQATWVHYKMRYHQLFRFPLKSFSCFYVVQLFFLSSLPSQLHVYTLETSDL